MRLWKFHSHSLAKFTHNVERNVVCQSHHTILFGRHIHENMEYGNTRSKTPIYSHSFRVRGYFALLGYSYVHFFILE